MKKPYQTPKLTRYGTLPEMTNGGGRKGRLDSANKGHKT